MKLTTPSLSLSVPDTKTFSINSKLVIVENQTCLGCVSARLANSPPLIHKSYSVLLHITSSPPSSLNLNSHFDGRSKQRRKIRRRIVVAEAGDRDPSNQNSSVSESEREQKLRETESPGVNLGNSGIVSRDALWGGDSQAFRRVVVAGLLGTSVILGGNLAGITSLLLGLDPSFSRGTRADLIFPVQGFKRCLESSEGFGKSHSSSLNMTHVSCSFNSDVSVMYSIHLFTTKAVSYTHLPCGFSDYFSFPSLVVASSLANFLFIKSPYTSVDYSRHVIRIVDEVEETEWTFSKKKSGCLKLESFLL